MIIKISFKKLRPTKTNLINLQKNLDFAEKGKKFLEFKREQIIFQIKKYWNLYISYRKEFIDLYRRIIIKYNLAYGDIGWQNMNLISNLGKAVFTPLIRIKYEKFIGNTISKIELELMQEKKFPFYSFQDTNYHIDDLTNPLLKDFFNCFLLFAEIEDTILQFAINFKKLNRRINGLEKKIIPNIKFEMKQIKEILDGIEQEKFIRFKKIKEFIIKKWSMT